MNAIVFLASFLTTWILKTVLYHYGFRWRHIHATFQTKLVVAGASMVIPWAFPFPLPRIVLLILAVAVSLYLCKKWTDGKLYPDLAIVAGGIEILGSTIIDRLLVPAIF